ncbi:hypothetical protein [[Mycoplasma] testudinis]|nr:hypothetical protein [[Mycoplasma] testudinis]
MAKSIVETGLTPVISTMTLMTIRTSLILVKVTKNISAKQINNKN